MTGRPDIIVIMTDQERATPPYESDDVREWADRTLTGRKWFDDNGVSFQRHYTGSLACVPSRPTLFTGQYPDLHGVTQTDGLGKAADDSRIRWLRQGEVPTLGNWFRAGGYDTHYDGKWHITHADLLDDNGQPLATNDGAGNVDQAAVQAYMDADPLDPFGFSGWVGPEPHGAGFANCGLSRDQLIANRVVAWLEDRYQRRRDGQDDALRPFLLVASFVNPHDIVLFPAWVRRNPLKPSPLDPPHIAAPPTADEDLSTKPAAQIAYRAAYATGYGAAPLVRRAYRREAQQYRDMYYRLLAEVDAPLDRVRRAVTEGGSDEALLVRTSDHGELLGAHGGLHQKWFNLYDEATRVPFVVARIGSTPTTSAQVDDMATSHVDLVPTLLAAAGIDEPETAADLGGSFSEVHPLPGHNLLSVLEDPSAVEPRRVVYLMTRDNILEGDSGASALARGRGRAKNPPALLRIQLPAHVAGNFEAIVTRPNGNGLEPGFWKLVRTFDDPATWTEPHARHLAASGPGGWTYRTEPLDDQWELYDLTTDPIEAHNRWEDPEAAPIRQRMVADLDATRAGAVPPRNVPWPYATMRPQNRPRQRPPAPARGMRSLVQRLGMHPEDVDDAIPDLAGQRALIVCTNHGVLEVGKATGLFASEMTAPYYLFSDAGMEVDIASPLGGIIPVDPQSLNPILRSEFDDLFLADPQLRAKVTDSLALAGLDMSDYRLVYLAGGWGAAFDFGFSEHLAAQITEANRLGLVIGGVCHGPLGLRNAEAADGSPLVEGRKLTAVTDKQVRELGITATPHHPETELVAKGALFESKTRFRDPFANHWVVDDNLVTGQNQNAAPMVAREMLQLIADNPPMEGSTS